MSQETLEIIEKELPDRTKIIVKVNTAMLNKIRMLIDSNSRYWANQLDEIKQNSQELYEIPSETLAEILDSICRSNDIRLEQGYMNFENSSSLSEYMNDYNRVFEQYKNFREEDGYSVNEFYTELFFDENKMKTFFDLATQLREKEKNFYVIRDLSNSKDDIIANLKYFMSDEAIHEIESRYEQALSQRNIDGMKQVLNATQQLILDHWKNYVSNIENFKQGDNFKFICHSTSHVEYSDEFYTKYVSTSLLSENLMDTYKMGFGFIFAPENIAGAKSKDMFVKNTAESEDDLLHYSTIKKIDSPERLIEECMQQKAENQKNGINEKVYNEVVLDGFNPMAIFCLTDGSMGLNTNYSNANELKKQFPNLKVVEIDTTYYKKDAELFETKKELIRKIREKIAQQDPNFYNISAREQDLMTLVNDDMVSRYDMFWNQFMDLKKRGNYTEEDIVNLYKYNDKLVSVRFIDPAEFDKLNDVELDTILKSNYFMGVHDVLNGKIELWKLDKVYETLSKYADNKRMDNIIPGLTTFFELYKKASLTPEFIEQLNQCSSFVEINQQLINNINVHQVETQKSVDDLSQQADSYRMQITEYQRKIYKKQAVIEEYNESKIVEMYECSYSIANTDIESEEQSIEQDKNFENYYKQNEERIADSISKNDDELVRLRKHPILNAIFINKIVKEQVRNQFFLQAMRDRKNEHIESIRRAEQKISDIKKEFQHKTGIDFSKYEQKLAQAKRNIDGIDAIGLQVDINAIMYELQDVQEKLRTVENKMTTTKQNSQVLTPEQIIALMEQGYSIDQNGQLIMSDQEQMASGRQRGFVKLWMLGVLTTLVTFGTIVLGIMVLYK